MPSQLQRRRGTTAEHAAFTGAEGEITVDTVKKTVVVHDGATPGGFPLVKESALAAPGGAGLVGTSSGDTVQASLNALTLADYTALRTYAGAQKSVYVTGYLVSAAPSGIAGLFTRDDSDTTSADNGGTIIVDASGRRWKRVLHGFVTPEMFGVVGSGLVNDRDALYRALLFACSTGTTFIGGGGTYRIDSNITINRAGMPPVIIDWNGSNVVCNGAGIQFTGDVHFLTTALSVEPLRGDAKLSLASVMGVQQGDLIEIESPALTQGTINTLHYYLVAELDVNDVYIEGNVVCDIKAQQVIDSGRAGDIVVRVYHLNKKLTVVNGNVTAIDANGSLTALLISKNYMTVVDNMTFDGHCRNQLFIQYNGHDVVSRIRVRDFGYINKDMGYANLPAGIGTTTHPVTNSPNTGDAGLSYGYGIIHARNYSSIVRDCIAGHGWHLTDASRGQMHIIYDTLVSSRNGYGSSTHEGSWYVTWRNCEYRGTQGINAGRCAFPTIENCKFIDTRTQGVTYSQFNVEVVIRGNVFDIQRQTVNVFSAIFRDTANGEPGAGSLSTGYTRVFLMENNTVYGYSRCHAGFQTALNKAGTLRVQRNYLRRSNLSIFALTNTVIEDNMFDVVMNQFAVTLNQVAADTILTFRDNHETGGATDPGPAMVYLNGTASPLMSSFIGNETTGTLLLLNYAVTLDVVAANYARGRILSGNNTQTVKNKINNLQGVVDYQVAITNNVNNAVMTL